MSRRGHHLLIVVATLISFGAPLAVWSRESLALYFYDDAFYYFTVARNIAAGNGVTFDGIHLTNGFHPLWLALLVPVFGLVPGDAGPLLAVALLELAIIAFALAVFYTILSRRLTPATALAGTLLLVSLPGARRILQGGLETALLFALLVLVWAVWGRLRRTGETRAAPRFLLGALCALAFLARLEAALLVPLALLLGQRHFRRHPAAAGALASLPVLTGFLYAVCNRVVFATWVPVSGVVKSFEAGAAPLGVKALALANFPWLGRDLLLAAGGTPTVQSAPPVLVVLYVAGSLFTAAALWRGRHTIGDLVRRIDGTLLLTACFCWLALDVVTLWFLPPWYRLPLLLMTTVALVALLEGRPLLLRVCLVACLAILALRVPLALRTHSAPRGFHAPHRVRAAEWLRAELSPGTRVASWNAGALGYFSHRPVINLDGLVNDMTYYREVIRGHDLQGYLERQGIAILADQACGVSPTLRPYLARTGSEELEASLTRVALFVNESAGDRCPGYGIWRRESLR